MKLFYIDGDDADGFNCSMFIWADTPEEAFEVWKTSEIGQTSGDYFADALTLTDLGDADEEDLRIFEIALDERHRGALPWHSTSGVHCVAYAKEA